MKVEAWKVYHPSNPKCYYIGDLPEQFRLDTGYPDEYFGGKAVALVERKQRMTLDEIDKHIGTDEGDREAVVALVREVEKWYGIAD